MISIFVVTNLRTGRSEEVKVSGCGQETVKALRKDYPKHTKFVLDAFEINGKIVYPAIYY